jgi:hypothetical protein
MISGNGFLKINSAFTCGVEPLNDIATKSVVELPGLIVPSFIERPVNQKLSS